MTIGTRPLDLYDFFSVFIPGAAFLVGLLPFLPENTDPSLLGTVIPLVIGGYVVGRGFHSLAAWFDGRLGETHRTRFYDQITMDEPEDFDTATKEQFFETCNRAFGSRINPDGDKITDESPALRSLYCATRSRIHIDGRGRSRTFQAVYAFHRSMWVIVVVLGVLYLTYAGFRIERSTTGIVAYRSIVRGIEIDPLVLFLLVLVALSLSFATFRRSKKIYRQAFVEYLVADFLTIAADSEGSSVEDNSGDHSHSSRHDQYHGVFVDDDS